jgi:hypothetical protein
MATDGSVMITWPDGERKYRLGIGEIRELQDKCDAGPAQIFKRLSDGTWRLDDARETIRLGLIGGGLDPQRALGIVGRYCAPGNILPAVAVAQTIMFAALAGDPNDPLGKEQAGTATAATTETGESHSRLSTETVPPSDGLPAKSINAQSLNS